MKHAWWTGFHHYPQVMLSRLSTSSAAAVLSDPESLRLIDCVLTDVEHLGMMAADGALLLPASRRRVHQRLGSDEMLLHAPAQVSCGTGRR